MVIVNKEGSILSSLSYFDNKTTTNVNIDIYSMILCRFYVDFIFLTY